MPSHSPTAPSSSVRLPFFIVFRCEKRRGVAGGKVWRPGLRTIAHALVELRRARLASNDRVAADAVFVQWIRAWMHSHAQLEETEGVDQPGTSYTRLHAAYMYYLSQVVG
jgi:hypothetical protein